MEQNNKNIKITSNTIVLPILGKVHYRTSPQYKQLLKESKINNVTIKKEHNHYYAVFNIETEKQPMKKTGEAVGIDLGIRTLATLSNGLKDNQFRHHTRGQNDQKIPSSPIPKKIQQQPLQ